MAGGNPFATYDIAGLKIPRYRVISSKLTQKMTMIMLGLYAGVYGVFALKSRFTPPPPITFESKEEESFVNAYVQHAHQEAHKPELLRKPFSL